MILAASRVHIEWVLVEDKPTADKDLGGVRATTMQAAILAMGTVSLVLLLATFGMGYSLRFGLAVFDLGTHVRLGLASAILTILTHTTTMFYFLGTGAVIKSEVRERDLDPEFLVRARGFKSAFFTWLTFGILAAMLAAILGGGAHADLIVAQADTGRSVLAISHEIASIAGLGINLVALIKTPIFIAKNSRLLDEVGVFQEDVKQV